MKQEITTEAVKAAPPVAVSVAAATDALTLNDWMLIATIGYVLIQAGYLIWKWFREWRRK